MAASIMSARRSPMISSCRAISAPSRGSRSAVPSTSSIVLLLHYEDRAACLTVGFETRHGRGQRDRPASPVHRSEPYPLRRAVTRERGTNRGAELLGRQPDVEVE